MTDGNAILAVVDDDEFMRAYLSETLASGGYSCRAFASATEVLGWLASGDVHPALLLSDVNMPGLSGIDLLRTVKAVAPDVPFVLLSGSGDLPVAQGALRAGAADYLLKPIRPADLLNLVGRFMGVAVGEQTKG